MSVGLLLLAIAAPGTIDVHVGANAPTDRIRVERCRLGARPVDNLRARSGAVAVCRGERCEDVPRAELACDKGVVHLGDVAQAIGDRLVVTAEGGRLVVVATLPLEAYVSGVVRAELGTAPVAAKEAQAIVARTFAMRASVAPRHAHAHVCDLTHCQVFRPAAEEAFAPGRVLLDERGDVAEVYFHGACGGHTRAARDVWPRSIARAPGVADLREDGQPWCRDGRMTWRHAIDVEVLAKLLSSALGRTLDPKTLVVEQRGDVLVGDARGTRRVSSMVLQRTIAKSQGWNTIESPTFTIAKRGRQVVFEGTGRGHGVGLCQSGAIARAHAGQTAEAILDAYFPTYAIAEVAGPPLRVGTTGDHPPFSEATAEGDRGIDVDLARAIGRRLRRPVVFVRTSWPTLLEDLGKGRFDFAMSGITVTKARAEHARFSRPYYRGAKREPFDIAALAPKGSPYLEAIDAALAELEASGELARTLSRHQ